MATKPATVETLVAALHQSALRHPGVEETVACKGTALESASFKAGGKAFLFLRPGAAMVKLAQSLDEAARIAAQQPDTYRCGSGGWTTVKLSAAGKVPLARMTRWLAESHRVVATPKATKKK